MGMRTIAAIIIGTVIVLSVIGVKAKNALETLYVPTVVSMEDL